MALRRLALAATIAAALSIVLSTTVLAAQPVYRQGTGHIKPSYGVDLDTGTFSCSCPVDEDVWYYIGSQPNPRFLENSAFAGVKRMSSKPSYATCSAGYIGSNTYNVRYNIGHWFCVRTSHGRMARVRIDQAAPYADLYITYKVWCKLNDGC